MFIYGISYEYTLFFTPAGASGETPLNSLVVQRPATCCRRFDHSHRSCEYLAARLRASHALRPGAGIVPLVRGFRNKVIEPLFRQALVHILGQPWFTVEHRKMSNAKFNCLDLLPRCQPLCQYRVVGRLHIPRAAKKRVYQHRNFPLTVFAPQHQGILPLHLPRSNSRMYGSYGCRTS